MDGIKGHQCPRKSNRTMISIVCDDLMKPFYVWTGLRHRGSENKTTKHDKNKNVSIF